MLFMYYAYNNKENIAFSGLNEMKCNMHLHTALYFFTKANPKWTTLYFVPRSWRDSDTVSEEAKTLGVRDALKADVQHTHTHKKKH